MARIFYDRDADLDCLRGQRIAVLGYGSQGQAHARNLRESGMDIVVGLHEGSRSCKKAREDGFRILPVSQAVSEANFVVFLVPDSVQADLYAEKVEPHLKPGTALVFPHGSTLHHHQVKPPKDTDVFMIEPKSSGHLLRRMFTEGKGVPGLIAIFQDSSGRALNKGLAYGSAIGCGRAGIIETSLTEETQIPLFREQANCGGSENDLAMGGINAPDDLDHLPKIAYLGYLNELKLIVNMMFESELAWMRYSVSSTEKYGDRSAGEKLTKASVRTARNYLQKKYKTSDPSVTGYLKTAAGGLP